MGVGVLGAFLPVLPSTCFFILAAYYFGKSSTRLESWVLNHPTFGPSVISWRRYRAMSRLAKIAALSGISFGQVMLILTVSSWWGLGFGTLFLVSSAIYIISRPTLELKGLDLKS